MSQLKRALFAAVSGFALACLVGSAWQALREDALQGWSAAGLDWLVLEDWRFRWAWQLGLAGGALGMLLGWCFGGTTGAQAKPGPMGRLMRCFGHPAVAIGVLLISRYAPGISAASLEPERIAQAPNVVLVVVDTWRADHTSFLGYERDTTPGLARLAEQGIVFEQAKAQSGWTKPSVATILTGTMPSRHLAISQPGTDGPRRGVNLSATRTTLIEVLRSRGWRTGMWSNNPNIIPERGFDQGAQDFVGYRRGAKADSRLDRGRAEFMLPEVQRWIERTREPERPFCAYVHIMDPHLPYEAPVPFGGSFDKSGLDFQIGPHELQAYQRGELSTEGVTAAMLTRIKDAYDEELAYVDHHLSAFVEQLRSEHPNTVIVVLGDHGEEFLEHGQFGHAHSLYEELVHVPLLIWGPGLEPRRIPTQVRLMDVMPTLLELAGVSEGLSLGLQGEDLAPLWEGSEDTHRMAPMETGGEGHPNFHWRGISDGRFKWLRREADLLGPLGSAEVRPWESSETRPFMRLFDLKADPGELLDLGASQAARAAALFAAMQAEGWYRSPTELFGADANLDSASQEELDDLGKLGYGEGLGEQD